MSDDDDFAPPAHICAGCGFARGPGHVCRTAKKPMRQSYRAPAPSSKMLGKRRAAPEEWEGTSDDEGVIALDDSDDDDEAKPLAPRLAKKARTAPPDSKPAAAAAAAGGPDPHAFLTSILQQHTVLSKDLSDATSDNTKLSGENQKLAKELAKAKADLTKAKAATNKEKKEKEKAQAAAQATAQAAQTAADAAAQATAHATAVAGSSAGLKPVQAAYDEIINEVKKQYNSQMTKFAKKYPAAPPAPPPPPPPAPAPSGAPYAQIQQFNTNPQYPTTREVKFWAAPDIAALPTALAANATSPLQQSMFPQPGFYFEDGMAGSDNWRFMQDATATSQLLTLGTSSTDPTGNATFTPTVGNTCQYTVGQHTYSVTVAMATPPPPPPPPAPPPPPPGIAWQSKLLFDEPTPVHFKTGFLTALLDNHAWGGDDSQVVSPNLASLAELFSSLGQGFKYDSKSCFLWCKPDWFKMWLRTAISRGYTHCRVGMHGSGSYDELGKDVAGYNMEYARSGLKKHALYVAASDHIASDYNHNFKRGSCMIGLLLTKKSAASGAYEQYHLGSHSHTAQTSGYSDAIAVRDQLLWLPLGKAVAI